MDPTALLDIILSNSHSLGTLVDIPVEEGPPYHHYDIDLCCKRVCIIARPQGDGKWDIHDASLAPVSH